MADKDLYSGLIRLHILAAGRMALEAAKIKVRELVGELFDE